MNLVWFLTIGTVFSVILGEFGQYPFGNVSSSISLTDILLSLTIGFFLIWKIGVQRQVKLPRIFYLLIGFWIIGGISLLLSGILGGGLYLIRFIFYSLSFLIGFEVVKFKGVSALFKVIISSLVLLIVLGFIQILVFPDISFLTDFGYDPHKGRLVSTFLDPNLLGAVLNIGFVLSLYFLVKQRTQRWVFISVIFALGIFLTFSRSAYLAMVIPILIFGIFKLRKILLISLIVGTLLFLLVPQFNQRLSGAFQIDKTSSERIESWQKGLTIFYQKPILGVGFNNIRVALEENNLFKVFSSDGGHSGSGIDSSLILVFSTTGIIGGVVYLSFWLLTLYKLLKGRKLISLELKLSLLSLILAILINSQFINSLFFPPVMLLMYLIIGGFWASLEREKQ